MKTLPNQVRVFNATPHPITFWAPGWTEPISIETDKVINAEVVEEVVEYRYPNCVLPIYPPPDDFDYKYAEDFVFTLVRTRFVPDDEGQEIINKALALGADVIVGSIIAAQAYPGQVVAMIPAAGYERVASEQKRMNPNRFCVF